MVFLFANKQVGWINIPLFNVPKNSVRVKFINDSDFTIKTISINGEILKMLESGDNYTYTYEHSEEGTYQFEIEFENGTNLRERERYVEAGYYIAERIKNNSVETQY